MPPRDLQPSTGNTTAGRSFGAMQKMYGRYTRDLADFAKEEATKAKKTDSYVPKTTDADCRSYSGRAWEQGFDCIFKIWKKTFGRVGEDWIFLAVLGILMACVSFIMDTGIGICNKARLWLYRDLANSNMFLQYLSWVSLPVCLILFSAGFAHITAPQAVGSGIPEMKTILRGVVLKEYLTFKTLIAKVIGLTATLGSGLPLGKEGPFVHIASMVATLLSKVVTSFKGISENENRNIEMLAAACAVGVACSFASPVGGVLFSIEVTTVYFAVRNYWRGFFAAVCGAMVFRLLAVWFHDEETLTALFRTNFKSYPFEPMELFVFAVMGVVCGLLGAFFVWSHRRYVNFMRKNKKMKTFLQKSRLLYPFLVTLVLATLSFPPGFGMFMAGHLTTHEQVKELFSNFSFTKDNPTVTEFEVIENWRTPWTNVFVCLMFFIMYSFTGCVIGSTMPVPCGLFIPVFKAGAGVGRIFGEAMALLFPEGLRYGNIHSIIIPGGYAIAGAAAFSGAVTHTISTTVIVFELTGQMTHIIPVMIAVLIANAIAQLLQPSIYDSIIQIKKLPYLPDILMSTARAYNMYVEDFMIRNVKYIWYGITYRELKNILINNKKIRFLPLVDSHDSMVLLGSIQRTELIDLLEEHLGVDRRAKVIGKWKQAANKAITKKVHDSAENVDEVDNGKLFEKEYSPVKWNLPDNDFGVHSPLLDKSENKSKDEKSSPSTRDQKHAMILPLITTTDCKSSTDSSQPNSIVETLLMPNHIPELDPSERRPSRFAVTKVETPSKDDSSVTLPVAPIEISVNQDSNDYVCNLRNNTLPRKSILKKTRSFIIQPGRTSPMASPQPTPYATVHAGDFTLRSAIEALLHKRNLSKLETRSVPKLTGISPPLSPVKPPHMTQEELWEQQQRKEKEALDMKVDFSSCQVDPSPFQLVERTSLMKVHSLFSMLSLNHAYVTAIGRLIGVVALKELRRAIEVSNLGVRNIEGIVDSEEGRTSPPSSVKSNSSS